MLPLGAFSLLEMRLPEWSTRKPEEKGPLSVSLEQGADINVIGGKRLLGFCSSEKYISLK